MPSTRVLVADDLPHLALFLQHILKKGGYEATVIHRAEEIQPALDEFLPAALLLNVEMQGQSGLEICRALRREKRNAALCIVFIAGNVFETASTEIAASGANGFLLKPVSPGALLAKLNELGLAPDNTFAAAGKHDSGSGIVMSYSVSEELSILERFKLEVTLSLAPLASILRTGAYWSSPNESGWLVRPDNCKWTDPDKPGGGRDVLSTKLEPVQFSGSPLCTVHLCTDTAGEFGGTGLKIFSSLLRQTKRVVEFGKQREDLFEELGLDHECLNSLYEISAEGQLLRRPEQAFERIVKRTARALSVSGQVNLALWIFNPQTKMLEVARRHQSLDRFSPLETRVVRKIHPRPPDAGLVGACFTEQRSRLANMAGALAQLVEPEFEGARHVAIVPVKSPNGMLGVFAAWHPGEWNFDSRHMRLLDAMAAQTAAVIENDSLLKRTIDSEIRERELSIGAKIQESLLFGTTPGANSDFEFGVYADPSLQIGGDFFEFFRYGSSCDMVIGDVMGKGVPAALVGAAVKGQFLRYAREQRGDGSGEPRNIVAAVHREVSRRLINLECFITVCYARFEARERKLTYVDCGHPRPLHFRSDTGQAGALEFDWPRLVNIPLGTHPEATYEETSVDTHPGDVFLFYSDGFTEAVGQDDRLFGENALLTLLMKHNARHADEIAATIQASLKNFVKAGTVRDDLTCIVVKILDSDVRRDGPSETLVIDARADQLPRLRAFIQARCESIPYFKQEEQQLYNLQLAVTEAATNIVKYAYKDRTGGKIRIELIADHEHVDIKLFDTGAYFDPGSVVQPVMEGLQESGRGVYMIKGLMDKVSYLRDEHNVNCLHMVKIIERRRKRSTE